MKSFKQIIKEGKPANIALAAPTSSDVSIPTSSDPTAPIGKGSNSRSSVANKGTGLGWDKDGYHEW